MSDYSVDTLSQELEGMLHGTSLSQIVNLNGVINRSARQLLLEIDPQETKRTVEFVNPIFNTVFDYPIAADLKGNKIIDIFPQVQRIPRDVWSQVYSQEFDVAKQNIFSQRNMFVMDFNTGLKTIRINSPFLNPPVIINQLEGISVNGTWAVGGTASNLAENNTNVVQGVGSLQFDTTTGAAYLENSTMSAVDLSDVVNQAYLFVWVYVPTGASLTSVNLRWGSSASNYYTETVTTNQQGNTFVNGWNQCQFKWSTASTTGTPNPAAINYSRITLNTSANLTGCLLNGLDSILGTILSYSYYSKYLFRDATTGAFKETTTDTSDLINLDTESFNLMTYLVAYNAAQQQQGLDAQFYDANFFLTKYQEGVAKYKSLYKSEIQKPQSLYYRMTRPGFGRFLGRWNP